MKTTLSLISFILFVATAATVRAQTPAPSSGDAAAPPSAPAQRSEADLENIVAPIALYPDPLLSVLLPASAYPLDIVQAARFIKDTNNISKLDAQPWDSNVKALAHFPEVLQKMNEDVGWTSDLGQAFVDDQKGVMNAIQVMRAKAKQVGSLKTTPQQIVIVTNTIIEIQPAQTEVIYVPQYNPAVVYVTSPGPSAGDVAAASIISFGVGLAVGAIIANNCDWHAGGIYVGPHGGGVIWGGGYHGSVNVNRNVNINVNQNVNVNRNINQNANVNHAGNVSGTQKWQPDASRHNSAPAGASAESRGWGSSPAQGGNSAFSNFGGSAQTRQASSRGASSRGGGFRGRR